MHSPEEPLDLSSPPRDARAQQHEGRAAPSVKRGKVVMDGDAKVVVSPEGIDIGVHDLISFRVSEAALGPVGDALVSAAVAPSHYAFILPDGRVINQAPPLGSGGWLSVSSDQNSIVTLSRFAAGMGGGFKSWDMHADIALSLGMASQEIAQRLRAKTPAEMMHEAGGVAIFTHSELMLEKLNQPNGPTLEDHMKRVDELSRQDPQNPSPPGS